jgi:adenylyl-sulfate kinase
MSTKSFTVWLCGPPRAGKTTLGRSLARELSQRGLKAEHLDGGDLRQELWPELGHAPEQRLAACLRTAQVAAMLNQLGVNAVVSQIAPYADLRAKVRARLERYVEVYLDCPLETLINRDSSGLYQKALAGEIKGFTGLDDPFEPADGAEIVCPTGTQGPEESLRRILAWLETAKFIPPTGNDADGGRDSAYTPEEEEKVIARLKDLGYL